MTLLIDLISLLRLLALYMATFGFLFARNAAGMNLWIPYAISGVTLYLLMHETHRKDARRFLPLLLLVLLFVPYRNIFGLLAVVPLVILIVRNTIKRSWHTTFDMTLNTLRFGVPVYLLIFVFLLPNDTGAIAEMPTQSVPFFVVFLALTLFGLRILRHEDLESLDRRYILLNLGVVLGLLAVCGILSSKVMMELLITLMGLLYKFIIMPVLVLLMGILLIIPYGIYRIISWVLSQVTMKPANHDQVEHFGEVNREIYKAAEQMVGGDVLQMVLRGLAVAAFIILIIILIKKFGGQVETKTYFNPKVDREDLSTESTGKHNGLFHRNSPTNVIRKTYQQFLKLTAKHAIPVDGSIASDRIALLSEETIHSDEPAQLRSIWLPVRYGSEATEENAQQAKDLLKAIRKKYHNDKKA